MKVILHLPVPAEEASKRLNSFLTRDGFFYSEEDQTYSVEYKGKEAEKTLTRARFWSRKILGGKYPLNFSLVIEGEIRKEGEASIMELELVEFHTNRPHYLGGEGGAASIDEYFDKLIKIM